MSCLGCVFFFVCEMKLWCECNDVGRSKKTALNISTLVDGNKTISYILGNQWKFEGYLDVV